ncbi:MAG: hypothetical protein ACXVRJ_02810 [Gaiellaceae bacterium]
MQARGERLTALTGVLAIVLWIVGLVAINSFSDKIPHHPTDEQILTWVKGNTNSILLGGWLWMVGCVSFVWFANVLRVRLAAAEGGVSPYATLSFAGALGSAVFGMLSNAGDVGTAINKNSVSAATAGALHNGTDMFFVVSELTMILFFLGAAIAALRTGALPRWWAYFAILIAIVLVIGPIGWAALIFGTPVWILGTTVFLLRPGPQPRAQVAAASA